MGWDGSGGYNRVHNFSADASAGIKILAARMDAEINDIASAFTRVWTRDGQNVPTTDIPMGGRRFVNVGAPTSIENFVRVREIIENIPIFMQDAESSADRISVSSQYFTSVSANQAPGDGTKIMVRVGSNKSSAVMYLDGHSANVEYQDGNRIGAALISGGIYEFTYSSVDTAWKLPTPSDGRTPAEIAAGVTVVNSQHEEGVADRYLTNTTPGTTDMTAAIQAALNVHNAGGAAAQLLAATYLTGNIDWPGNNLTLRGASSAYAYNSAQTPKTKLKAKTGTTVVLDLFQTGTGNDRSGNHISDIDVDGNSIALVGISVSGVANVIERCRATGCTEAGIRLENFTNDVRLRDCGMILNSGWGLHITGVSTTDCSVIECNMSLNTLGGWLLEGGVIVKGLNCVVESNTGPAIKINRDSAHSSVFGFLEFEHLWIEDNGATGGYVIVIESELSGDASKDANRIIFRRCRISVPVVTRKYLNAANVKWLTFDTCAFSNSTETTALNLTSTCSFVSFIECGLQLQPGGGSTEGLTAAQLDSAIAQGTSCYSSDRAVKRVVDAGAPAAAFTNSWVNEGGGYGSAKYWFDTEGEVHLEGAIQTGTITTSAFTLPVGYRPAVIRNFAVDSNGAYGMCAVHPDGSVVPTVGSNARFHLDGIVFSTG